MVSHITAQVNDTGIQIYETAAAGYSLREIRQTAPAGNPASLTIHPEQQFQTITGFGGSFTESSAYLLNRLSKAKRDLILKAYFSKEGADYSLTRTHINSCDFSLGQYAYASIPGDTNLVHFSIDHDKGDLIPMIRDAMKMSKDGFKIIASPWTAPPWMKDNQDWRSGKLLPQYRKTWALYFSKYIKAYQQAGISIWGITVENEPLGNGGNWESMHYSPEEMRDFVRDYLGPHFQQEGLSHIPILGYDQNRGKELMDWVKVMYEDKAAAKYFGGTAVHWYNSTYDYFPASLDYAHQMAPSKYLINTEACVDAEVPAWKNDRWYWQKEATDWGWDWAAEHEKYLHPKYAPVHRYATDIMGCLNHHVDGWVDWNMVLDKQGGPNWFKNWCTAPVIVDPETDEVYFTPLYYTMVHFSRFIRPGAIRIGLSKMPEGITGTAVRNTDGSVVLVLFNPGETKKEMHIQLGKRQSQHILSGEAIQTIIFP